MHSEKGIELEVAYRRGSILLEIIKYLIDDRHYSFHISSCSRKMSYFKWKSDFQVFEHRRSTYTHEITFVVKWLCFMIQTAATMQRTRPTRGNPFRVKPSQTNPTIFSMQMCQIAMPLPAISKCYTLNLTFVVHCMMCGMHKNVPHVHFVCRAKMRRKKKKYIYEHWTHSWMKRKKKPPPPPWTPAAHTQMHSDKQTFGLHFILLWLRIRIHTESNREKKLVIKH